MEDQPALKQSHELNNFTQTVINMEKTISRITRDRNAKTSEEYNPNAFIDIISSDTHERSLNELQRNVNQLSQVKMKQSGQAREDSVLGNLGFENSGKGRRMGTSMTALAIETTAKKKDLLCQHAMGPKIGASREFEDNVVWTSPRNTQECFKSGLSNVTLSRVYFAQDGRQSNGGQVSADDHEHNTIEPEINGHLTLQSKIIPRQRNTSINIIMQTDENITNSSFNNLVSKSRRSREMFELQAGSGYKKPGDKRLFSAEVGEDIYFLPDYQERQADSLSCDEFNSDSNLSPTRTHFPRDKRSRLGHLVHDGIANYDEDDVVCTKGSKYREANLNFVQVVADSEGRIFVNVTETAKDERNISSPTINGEKHITQQSNYADIGLRTPADPSFHKYLKTTGRPSKTKHFENQTTETRSQTSALITNDCQWDSWKRTNCISCEKDGKNQRNLLTTMKFLDKEDQNNNVSEDKSPHLNKFIRRTKHSLPDNGSFGHAKLATQSPNFSGRCDENISKNIPNRERCFDRLPNVAKNNHSRSFQSTAVAFSNNNKRYVGMEKQVARYKQAQDVGNLQDKSIVIEVSSGHEFETTQQRCSLQEPNEDATFKCSGRQSGLPSKSTTVTVEDWEDHTNFLTSPKKNHRIQTSFSTFSSKSNPSRISSNRNLSLQPKAKRQNSNYNIISKTDKVEKRSKRHKENLRKCASSTNSGRYLCDWPACDKTFRHYSFLVLHKRIHTGERPYVCSWEGCSKQFRRSDDYQRHYRVHTGLKPYICTFCGKGFKRSDHRLFHYRAIHNMKDSKKRKQRNTNL